MRFIATFDGDENQVQTIREPGVVLINGEEFRTDVRRPSPERRVVRVGDDRYELKVVEGSVLEGDLVLELNGEMIPVKVSELSMRRVRGPARRRVHSGAATGSKAPAKSDDGEGEGIRAPMPGKVVEVFVEAGDEVEAGDVVLILEAMKMENELRSREKASVKAVNVKPGDSVTGNQLLIALG